MSDSIMAIYPSSFAKVPIFFGVTFETEEGRDSSKWNGRKWTFKKRPEFYLSILWRGKTLVRIMFRKYGEFDWSRYLAININGGAGVGHKAPVCAVQWIKPFSIVFFNPFAKYSKPWRKGRPSHKGHRFPILFTRNANYF